VPSYRQHSSEGKANQYYLRGFNLGRLPALEQSPSRMCVSNLNRGRPFEGALEVAVRSALE